VIDLAAVANRLAAKNRTPLCPLNEIAHDGKIRKSIRGLHERIKLLKQQAREWEDVQGKLGDAQRQLMLYSALRAHRNGKIHFTGVSRAEQNKLITDLLELQLNHFMVAHSEYPNFRSLDELKEVVQQSFQVLSLFFVSQTCTGSSGDGSCEKS
jgi:hypothetical protein